MARAETDDLDWLMRWYGAQCNGDWEHHQGVTITTLDNPGWLLTVNLTGTALAGRSFTKIAENIDAPQGDPTGRWHSCDVHDGEFVAAGGIHDLPMLIALFRAWAD
jgi:hypothetical protein